MPALFRLFGLLGLGLGLGLLTATAARAEAPFITLASTTSTEQSGLFKYLLPLFTAHSGIAVHVVAQGTGQALMTASKGDADLVLVHDRPAEDHFIADGFGIDRRDVMYNDFVVVGPKDDPAGISGLKDAVEAFRRLGTAGTPFISRGDRSGTNAMELHLWAEAGQLNSPAKPAWYFAIGQGMGPTLAVAAEKSAYTLADRGTWIARTDPGPLTVLVEGDPRLFNQYGVILVNPARFPHVKHAEARAFANWLVGAEGQAAIASYRIKGQQLFIPNAHP